jgi:hypothetical protein
MPGSNQKQTITINYVATEAQRQGRQWAADEQKRTKETAAVATKTTNELAALQKKNAREKEAEEAKAARAAEARRKKDDDESLKAALARAAALRNIAQRTSGAQIAVETILAKEKAKVVKSGYDKEEEALKNSYARRRVETTMAVEKMARDGDYARAKAAIIEEARRKKSAQAIAHITAQMKTQNAVVAEGISPAIGLAVAYAGFSMAVAGVKAMSEYFAKLRSDTFEAAKEVSGFREEVLELAAMKGDLGNSTPETVNQLKFRGKTGQSRQAALAMSVAMEGAGQAAIGKNVTQGAADQMAETAGKLQAMERSDPTAYGALGGTLMLESKKGTSGADLAGMFNKEYELQKPGKFLNMGQYAKQREQLTSYVQTGALTGPEAAGLLSALSLENSPDQAATMAQQILASTSADFMRARGMKVLPGTEHETSAAYFQEHLGLKKTATSKETWEAAADDINKAEAAAKAKKEPFSADKYLTEHGLSNQEARRGYAAMAAVRKQGQWQQFQTLIDAPLEGSAITDQFDDRRGRDQTIQKQLAQTAKDASMINASEGTPSGGLKEVQEAAFERLKAQHKITGTFAEWKNRDVIGITMDDFWKNKEDQGWHNQVNIEAQRMLAASAKDIGLPFETPRVTTRLGASREAYMGDEALYAKQQQIQKAGGDPLSDVATDIKRAANAMERTADAIEGKKKPLAVKPPPPVARP